MLIYSKGEVNLKKHLGISLSVGILAGTWAYIGELLGIPSWPGFIGWSIFFFSGANFEGCKKSLPCIVLGPILAYITIFTMTTLQTSGITSALIVVGLGFAMTIAQSFKVFELATATFISANIYFGLGNKLLEAIFITSVGLIIGIISIKLASFFDSIILKKEINTEDTDYEFETIKN